MFAAILGNELKKRAISALLVGGAVGAVAVLIFALTVQLGDTIAALTAGFPEAVTAFIGNGEAGGYAIAELFTLMAPGALVATAVVIGAQLIAGEEEAGTMALLASHPVTRTTIVGAKGLSLLVGLAGASTIIWVACLASAASYDVGVDATGLTAIIVHLLMLALAFGAIALALSAATGLPSIASGVTGGLAVAAYVSNAMLPLADLADWARLSPWYYYAGSDPLANGIDWAHLAVLAAIAVAATAVALWAFRRRDLRG